MKTTTFNSEISSMWTSIKSAFLAFQVIVIALAIPVLSYMEMSYDTKPAQEQSSINANHVELKQNVTAYNQ